MQIICLIGKKRVGKDTVADIIQASDSEYRRFALADPIKNIARIMFNFTEDQLFGAEKDIVDPRWGIRPRDFFERFGTDIMQFDIYKYLPGLESHVPSREFWAQSLINKLIQSGCQKVIITDVRGLHEVNAIRTAFPNACFIKITRRDTSVLSNGSNDRREQQHITQLEPELIPPEYIDYVIDNSSSLEELHEKVKKYI